MLHVFLFQNYNCLTWFSFSCSLIILFEVNRMCEDGRFELNVLFRRNCKSEIWVFICLETIFPSNDSLMRLTYIIYSFWLIFSFSQVKLTHSGSLCALLTPCMVIVIWPLRFVKRKNKNHHCVWTFFPTVSMLIRLRQTKYKEEQGSIAGHIVPSLQIETQAPGFLVFANSAFFIY